MENTQYRRLLDKSTEPSESDIHNHIGPKGVEALNKLEIFLQNNYQLGKALKFPFGNNYGWGYKYSHKAKHICYLFFEENAVNMMIQIGDKQVPALEAIVIYPLNALSHAA